MAFSEYVNFNISANYKRALSLLQSWIWKLLFNFSFPTYHIEYPHVHALRGNERKEIDGKQRSLRTLWAPFDFVIDRFWLGILRLEDTMEIKPFVKANHLFYIILTKGQIKPKADWRAVCSPEKRTNEFVLLPWKAKKNKCIH